MKIYYFVVLVYGHEETLKDASEHVQALIYTDLTHANLPKIRK